MAMTAQTPPLQKPPGYKEPNTTSPIIPSSFPPRKPVIPPTFHHKNSKPSRTSPRCCCITCTTTILLIFLLAAPLAMFYICYIPKLPQLSLTSISIPHYKVVQNSDGTYMHAQVVAYVQSKNPNSYLEVVYPRTIVSVRIEGHDVGSSIVPGFTQKVRNTTSMKFEIKGNVLVDDDEGKMLVEKYKGKDLIVGAEVKSGVGLNMEGLKIGPIGVDLQCKGVSLKKVEDNAPRCRMSVLRWFHLN